jgi:anthranilate synthase/aminodeoxychorismate synthase-like glutamine amidotransferase
MNGLRAPMVLLIDNYDSFVFNLARYVAELGVETRVVRNDAITLDDIEALAPAAIILSPGPCTPAESGVCGGVVRQFGPTIPLLGVCLGHQVIADALHGRVLESEKPVHGRTSLATHDGSALFQGVPSPFRVARYHSLVVERRNLPKELRVTAETADGVVMALSHIDWPLFGVQFHPESILTEHGHRLLANFLKFAGINVSEIPRGDLPRAIAEPDFYALPIGPGAGPVVQGSPASRA